MPTVRYSTSASGILDANGDLILTIPGPKPGQTISLDRVTLSIPDTKKIPAFGYYVGTNAEPNLIATSVTGQRDTDAAPNVTMFPGEFVTAVWRGGDPGAHASIALFGTLTF